MKFAWNIFRWYGRYFARPSLIKFNKFLFNLGMRGLGFYNFQDFFVTGELCFTKNYLMKKEKPIIFDVGANTGDYSLLCREVNSESKIFCFEPHPENFKNLQEKITADKNIIPFNLGLAANIGKLKLYDYQNQINSRHATLCKGAIETVSDRKTKYFEVNISTIDEIVDRENITKIDLLKIDVEGYELEVLKGANNSLESNIIQAIQFEFTQNNSTAKLFMKDFFDLLSSNYNFYRLLPYGLLPLKKYDPTMHEIFAYQNIICLKK